VVSHFCLVHTSRSLHALVPMRALCSEAPPSGHSHTFVVERLLEGIISDVEHVSYNRFVVVAFNLVKSRHFVMSMAWSAVIAHAYLNRHEVDSHHLPSHTMRCVLIQVL
jgi:hypothetical protein